MTTDKMTDAELADYYNSTHDLSEFDGGKVITAARDAHPETRSVTISVRFSPSELVELEQLASAAGMRLTTFIRAAALDSEEPPVDRAEVLDLLTALRESVEGTNPRRVSGTRRSASHTKHRTRGTARSAASGRYVSKSPAATVRTAASTRSGRSAAAKAVSKSAAAKALGKSGKVTPTEGKRTK
jgi:predicted DNA binding CopG/RHH family protein